MPEKVCVSVVLQFGGAPYWKAIQRGDPTNQYTTSTEGPVEKDCLIESCSKGRTRARHWYHSYVVAQTSPREDLGHPVPLERDMREVVEETVGRVRGLGIRGPYKIHLELEGIKGKCFQFENNALPRSKGNPPFTSDLSFDLELQGDPETDGAWFVPLRQRLWFAAGFLDIPDEGRNA